MGENHLFERNFSEIFARRNLTFAVSRNLTFEMSFRPWGRLIGHQGPRGLRQRDQMSPAKHSVNRFENQYFVKAAVRLVSSQNAPQDRTISNLQ